MKALAELLDRLFFTYSNKEKLDLLENYFKNTPDPDRGYGLGILAGTLYIKHFKRAIFNDLISKKIDNSLLFFSYDYVGDMAETISLLWPSKNLNASLPSLHEVIETLQHLKKNELYSYINDLLDTCNVKERWAFIKIATGELRIGVSERFIKQALADYGHLNVEEIEEIWHALSPPYEDLFTWLEKKSKKPLLTNKIYFHPVMLSHPINNLDLNKIQSDDFLAEWKYDGIRIQIVSIKNNKALFSRRGEDISKAFPEIIENIHFEAVLDGELVVKNKGSIGAFNDLQQRLNRKKPTKQLIHNYPGHIILYDVLKLKNHDLRNLSFELRRHNLEKFYLSLDPTWFSLSPLIEFKNFSDLKKLRIQIDQYPNLSVEGVMLKRKSSLYVPGRHAGLWYKWKRDPFNIDAVLMYAQRGHGIRSSFYSDYTFGLWRQGTLLPIGKAYFGFTDDELYKLDKWIRYHTIQKFGPVREVEKELVLEIAFDAIQKSNRHKSGFALRFPRINHIRWDKPAKEADEMSTLEKLFNSQIDK